MEQSFLNHLTDELLIEIFIRLPSSKEAIQCKSVCNRWLSLISSDYFLNTSLIHNRNYDKKTLRPFTFLSINWNFFDFFISEKGLDVFECSLEKGLSKRVNLGFLYSGRPSKYHISLEESYGDLILCSRKTSDIIDYYIVNVLTKQWIRLPPTPLENNSHYREDESVGFLIEPNCVDNAARYEYLVLRFMPWGDSKFSIQMFSSEKGKWTRLVVTSPRNLNILTRRTSIVACGRILYTFTYKRSDVVDCVLAFDPFTNDPAQFLCVIDFPVEARDIRCLACKLGVYGGRLRFAQLILQPSGYLCISIWEFGDDHRMGKWTLVHQRIPTDKAFRVPKRATQWISVLGFHPYNEYLICFLVGNDHVVVYNIQTDKVESSTLVSLFKVISPRSLEPDVELHHVVPITHNWWPTPVRQSLWTQSLD
ncbi:hypothetical protein H5410_018776 [Solanum commersonii]|uniref:F-box domain-containing protein n=1 Tax=Solanum commersonii TaxID=4109 RepID=A0A9J6A3G0_SOLCO|nr:hypothetical protein H5410_018776 [Solanum commersonii]